MNFKNWNKEVWITSLALFSLFFGAGNLILPPYLGFQAGGDWIIVSLAFALTAVVIPIFGIVAHARLQGTMFDFAKKVHPWFAVIYCLVVYTISITLPSPRTASVAYEMSIGPITEMSSLASSIIYFAVVFIFVINRSRVLNIVGKYLTPLIVLILLLIIVISVFSLDKFSGESNLDQLIISGLLEGYQTFDAIGAIVVGGVIIVSLKIKGFKDFESTKEHITKAGIIAGLGLFVIYAGLIFSGSVFMNDIGKEPIRTDILKGISLNSLGSFGSSSLSLLVVLACFTTAVGIVTGTADYMRGLFNNSKLAYQITASIGCLLGVIIGQFDVHYIIDIALPALMFIYPITIALIILNVLPERYASDLVFKSVIAITLLFSIPDFLKFIITKDQLIELVTIIPLGSYNLGWILPSFFTFIIANGFVKTRKL